VPLLASFLFAVALVHANGPYLLTAVLPGVGPGAAHPPGLARVNKLSGDAQFVALTVSAFVEMDTPTTRLKMMNDLARISHTE
jgi:hypothetical protein